MRIKINEIETYFIEIPENPNAVQFVEIVERLNTIRKIVLKEENVLNVDLIRKFGEDKNIKWKNDKPEKSWKTKPKGNKFTRQQVKDMWYIHIKGTKEEKKALRKKVSSALLNYWKNKYKIKKSELRT